MKSQNNEVEIVLDYFKGRQANVLEIGANDGITLSNSYDLIKAGWIGYLLEPGNVCADLIQLYKGNERVHIYNVGIGLKNERVPFFESGAHVKHGTDRGLVSSIHEHETLRWKKAGVQFKKTEIKLVTFEDWYKLAGSPILDFISIDTEGCEVQVLKQIDLRLVGCKLLCIEWNSVIDLKMVYTNYCYKFGMKQIGQNNENLIFSK